MELGKEPGEGPPADSFAESNESELEPEAATRRALELKLLDRLIGPDPEAPASCQQEYDALFKTVGGQAPVSVAALQAHIAREEEALEEEKKRQRAEMKRCQDSINAFGRRQDPDAPPEKAARTE